MTKLEFLHLCTGSKTHQLAAESDTEDRLRCLHSLGYVGNGSCIEVGIAGTGTYHHCIVVQCREVVVVRHAHHLEVMSHERADKAVLDTAVYEHYLLGCSFVIGHGSLTRDLGNVVYSVICCCIRLKFGFTDNNLAAHHTFVTQSLGQGTSVDARDTGNPFALHPSIEGLRSIPVAVLLAIVGHDESAHLYLVALEEFLQA